MTTERKCDYEDYRLCPEQEGDMGCSHGCPHAGYTNTATYKDCKMKPVAHYTSLAGDVVVGDLANVLGCYDHPAGLRGHHILTSRVQSYDKESGRIETENTVYIPYEQEDHGR